VRSDETADAFTDDPEHLADLERLIPIRIAAE
jgi:hypothetical protein